MIRMEYDVPTAGTRVSFVVTDGTQSSVNVGHGWNALTQYGSPRPDGTWVAPQNPETLRAVMHMLGAVLGDEVEEAKRIESFRVEQNKEEAARLEAEEDERRLLEQDNER